MGGNQFILSSHIDGISLSLSLPLSLPLSLKTMKKKKVLALAGVAQWIERRPTNQRVTGLVPSQGTCLGCGPGPQLGARKRQPHIDVSLPPSPSLSPKINK